MANSNIKLLQFETAKTPKKIEKFANMVIKHKLHLDGGLMSSWAKSYSCIKAITIVKRNGKPIAAGIRINSIFLNTGIFVKPNYRRQGIGSNILQRLKLPELKFCVGSGANGSVEFYEKNKPKFKNTMSFNWC